MNMSPLLFTAVEEKTIFTDKQNCRGHPVCFKAKVMIIFSLRNLGVTLQIEMKVI
jgi:hypothetical protein